MMRVKVPNSPVVVVAGRLVSVGLSFISAFILARALGPDGRGQTAAALAVASLLPVLAGVGLPLVVRRRAQDHEEMAMAIRAVRLIALVATIPSALVGLGLTHTLLGSLDSTARLPFVTACACAPIAVLWICDANVLLAHHRLFAYAVVSTTQTFSFVAVVTVGLALDIISVTFVIWANLLATVLTLAVTTAFVQVPLRGDRTSPHRLLHEGVSFAGSQVAEASSYRLDQAVALPIIGAAEAGYYSVAAAIAMLPFAVGQAIGSAVYEQVATTGQPEQRRLYIGASIRYAGMLATGTTCLVAAITPWAVPLAFGHEFAPAIRATLIALAGSVAVAVSYVASALLTAQGRGWAMTRAQVLGLFVGIAALFLWGPALGAVGASLASSLGYVTTLLMSLWALGLPVSSYLPQRGDLRAQFHLVLSGRLPDSTRTVRRTV